MEEWLEKDKITYFVHKNVRYFKKLGEAAYNRIIINDTWNFN